VVVIVVVVKVLVVEVEVEVVIVVVVVGVVRGANNESGLLKQGSLLQPQPPANIP